MITSTCPICKHHRRHKSHTDACGKKARLLNNESFISAYKAKTPHENLPLHYNTPARHALNRF